MNSRRIRLNGTAAALGLVLLLVAAGCTGDEEPTPTPTASQTADPTADAIAAAEEAVDAFVAAQNQVTANPASPTPDPATVATGSALDFLNVQIATYRNNGWTSTGLLEIIESDVFSVDLSGDSLSDPPRGPSIVFDLCLDSSKTDAVDANGQSVVSPDRPDRAKARITASETGGSWIVSDKSSSGEPCDGF